jgi:hypothetical protein
MVYQKQILLETRGHRQMHDPTADVFNVGRRSSLNQMKPRPLHLREVSIKTAAPNAPKAGSAGSGIAGQTINPGMK